MPIMPDSMKRPAVFFDRDNTLIVGHEYLGDPAKVQLVPGAAAAVARARRLGYATVVVSNQSGVARGLFDETAVQAVNQRLDQLLLADDPAAVIDRHEYCPFHPEATVEKYRQESVLRKPAPGMILKAAEKLALDLSRSWVVGDAPRDVEAGAAAGCRTILFTDPSLPPSPAAGANGAVSADFSAASLLQAIDLIEAHPEPPIMRIAGSTVSASNAPSLSDVAIASAFSSSGSIAASNAPHALPADAAYAPVSSAKPQAAAGAKAGSHAVQPPSIRGAGDATRGASSTVPQSTARVESGRVESGRVESARVESLLDQMLTELRRRDVPEDEFSVSKLLAGVVQVLAISLVFLAYLYRNETAETFIGILLFAIFLQVLTIALLIMGRQR